MALIRFSFYLSILLCTFYIVFCANDGSDSQKNKSMKKVDLDLIAVNVNDNEYFKEIRNQELDVPQEIGIKKSFTIEYFAHFFIIKLKSSLIEMKYTLIYSSKVCELINDKRNKSKIPDDFFPRLMVKELFPKINSCEFKAGSTFVNEKDTLWLNPKHQTSIPFPKEKNFYVMVNIGKEDDKKDPESSFVLSALWELHAGPLINALEDIKSQMIKTVNVNLYGVDAPKNDYFERAILKQGTLEIIIKKSFTIESFAHFFQVQLVDRGSKMEYKYLYSFKVCDLINDKRDKSKIPDDFFPRLMIKELFPKINSCEFKVGSDSINLEDTLHLKPEHQTGVVFPKDKKFYMIINFGKEEDKNDPENSYILSSFWTMQTFT